jgi:hypothetical protein
LPDCDGKADDDVPMSCNDSSMAFARRTARAVRLLSRDGGLPRWLRGLAAFGVAPIPGPFDELVVLVVAAILWLGYRERLRDAWRSAA